METDLLQSVIDEPPAKPARASSSSQTKQQQQQRRHRTLSIGFALNSNANFYDIPAVSRDSFFTNTIIQDSNTSLCHRAMHLMTCLNVMYLHKKDHSEMLLLIK
jgi:hypothetical protein